MGDGWKRARDAARATQRDPVREAAIDQLRFADAEIAKLKAERAILSRQLAEARSALETARADGRWLSQAYRHTVAAADYRERLLSLDAALDTALAALGGTQQDGG